MADKIYNQNISTEYEKEPEEKSILQKVWDFFSGAWDLIEWAFDAIWNRATWDKQWSIEKAQNAQNEIDLLTDSYFNNSNLTDAEKNNIATQIWNLEKTRDDALSWKDKWLSEWYDWIWRQIAPINYMDIYYQTNPWKGYEDFLKDVKWVQSSSDALKKSMEASSNSQAKSFQEQMKADLASWKTTEADIKSWKYLSDLAMAQKRWSGFYWYLNDFIQDVTNNSTPYNFSLATDDWVKYFFKDEQQQVISNIITSDDIQKAIQNNYNIVKKVEERLNSDDAWVVKYAQSDTVQKIYNSAQENLNNLKDEVRYIYENFGSADWNMYEIERRYMNEKWRQMFDQAQWSYWFRASNERYTSEDRATMAVNFLNIDSDTMIQHEYPNTREAVKDNLFSPVKSLFHDIGFIWNTIRDAWTESSTDIAYWANTFYTAITAFNRNDIDRDAAADINAPIQFSMWSVRSIRDELTDSNKWWNKLYNNALAIADAWTTISKEAYMFAYTEKLMDSMWVVSTSDMVKLTAEGSDKYTKVARWNLALAEKWQDIDFATKWIIQAKLLEFAWRWVVQNFILSAEATWNFSEWYTDLDFGLDLAFWMIDVFTLWHWVLLWKWKITTEARKHIMRTAVKDTLMITPEQWEILMSTAEWRKLVDSVAWEMWSAAVKSIDDLANAKWVTKDEIIAEITNAIKKSKNPEAAKVFIKQQDRILEQVQKNIEQSLAAAVYAKNLWKAVPAEILDKLTTVTYKDINWEEVTRAFRDPNKPLTKDEFITLMQAVDTPYIKKLWNKFQDILSKKWETRKESIENYKEQFEELERQEKNAKTEEERIAIDTKKRELNKEYKQYLHSIILEDPVRFRRWEYEKYWRPHGYAYDDNEYTYLALWNTKEEKEAALWKRLEEYWQEIEAYEKRWGIREEAQYVTWLTTESIKLSNQITWKTNLVWLSYEEAIKINPNLKVNWETFFNAVMFADYLEIYQKNLILWSTPQEWKILKENWFVTFEIKHWWIQAFGSLFEQEHFIGKVGTQWQVLIEWKWVVQWDYLVRRSPWGNVYISVKDENWLEYKIHVREGKLIMDKHTAKIVWWDAWKVEIAEDLFKETEWWQLNITFQPAEWNNHSWLFDLYWYEGNQLELRLERYTRKHPQEMWHYSVMQKAENALMKDIDNPIYSGKERNWYQTDSASKTFKNNWYLSSAQMTSWYVDIVETFDIPFSYFIELKKMIKKWLITEREWAALMLMAAGSWVWENADYFIVNAWAKIKWQLQTFMFHQCWVVMLPFWWVKWWWFKPYFYKRVTGIEWLYTLYWPESLQKPIWRLWINSNTWDIIFENSQWKHFPIEEIRVDKKIWADIDSKKYTYRSERFRKKEEKEFFKFVDKSKQESFNFYGVQDWKTEKEGAKNKYQIITKWDRRSMYTSYSSDMKVDKKNRKQVEDIYLFKNAMINQKSIWVSLFYSWFQYSVLTRFMSDNFGNFKNTKEITDFFLNIKDKWLVKDKNIINFDGDHMRVLIDTKDMWFRINYSIQDLKAWQKRSSLIFLVDDAATWWRTLSIDNIWLYDIKEIDWNTYLRVWLDTDGDIDYYIKLDDTLHKQDIWNVNTLALSRNDYIKYMETPWLMWDAIWKSIDDFVAKNIYNFPPEVRSIVMNWWSTSDVYAFMKSTIEQDPLMQEIARIKWFEIDSQDTGIADMLTVYEEFTDVVNACAEVQKLWYNISQNEMIKYYKYLYWQNTFGSQNVINVIDSVFGLWNFREQIVDWNIKEWLINLASLDKWLKLSWTSYNYFQKRIMDMRLAEFMEEYNKWYFREWLDLTNPKDYKRYVARVKTAYKYATEIISPDEIRWALITTKKKSKIIKDWTSVQWVADMASKVDTFGSILTDVKKWIEADNLTKDSFNDLEEDWENRWKIVAYNDWWSRSLEEMADIVDERLKSWISREEIVRRLQYWLLLWNSVDFAHKVIIDIERKILNWSNQYRWFLEVSRLNAWDTTRILSTETSELWQQIDDLIEIIKKDAVWLTDEDVKELEKLKKKALKLNEQWKDISVTQTEFVNKWNELANRSNEEIHKEVKEINNQREESKEVVVNSFEENKKVEEPQTVKVEEEKVEVQEEKIEKENIVNKEEKQVEESLPEETIIKDLDERKEKRISFSKVEDEEVITNDLIWYNQDFWHQLTISEFFAWHQHQWKGFWMLRDKLSGSIPAWNLFMNQTKSELYRSAWIEYFRKNKWNLAEFVKSEEWMEMMLYATLYRIPLPEEFLNEFNKVFDTHISKTWTEKSDLRNTVNVAKNDYDDAFIKIKDTYEKYFWVKIDVVEWNWNNVIKINYKKERALWEASNSMFNQMKEFRDDYVENWFWWLKTWDYTKNKQWRMAVPNYELQIYDVRKIAAWNESFIEQYNKYLRNARIDWAYYNKSIHSWPMSIYEFWTLNKLAWLKSLEWDESVKKYVKDLLKSKWRWRYMNIPYWAATPWANVPKRRKQFYNLLTAESNRFEFRDTILATTELDNEFIFSPYYREKLNEWLNDTTLIIDQWTFKKSSMNEKMLNQEKIIILWWDVDDITKYLDWKSDIYEYNIKYADEVEVTPIKWMDEKTKKIADWINDKNVEDSLKTTCK